MPDLRGTSTDLADLQVILQARINKLNEHGQRASDNGDREAVMMLAGSCREVVQLAVYLGIELALPHHIDIEPYKAMKYL